MCACTGMLSKSLGQILRVSVAMHVLFCVGESGDEDHSSDSEGIGDVDDDDTNAESRDVVELDSEEVEVGEQDEDEEVVKVKSDIEGNNDLHNHAYILITLV